MVSVNLSPLQLHDDRLLEEITQALADNGLAKEQAVAALRETLGVEQIAILPADPEDRLGHADGMAAFIASNAIAATRYDEPFRTAVLGELRAANGPVNVYPVTMIWIHCP